MSNEIFLFLLTMFIMLPGTIIIPGIMVGFIFKKIKRYKNKNI